MASIGGQGRHPIRCGHRIVSAQEYRDNAQECVGWAGNARTHREREIFLQVARAWLEAAEQAARRDGQSIRAIKASLEATATGPEESR